MEGQGGKTVNASLVAEACPAVNGLGHRCQWEKGHELGQFSFDENDVLGKTKVHGYYNRDAQIWEVWAVQ